MLELEISPVDFPTMCRLCLKSNSSQSLLESSKYLSLIHNITNIKVSLFFLYHKKYSTRIFLGT